MNTIADPVSDMKSKFAEWLATYESWQMVCLSYYAQSLIASRQPKSQQTPVV